MTVRKASDQGLTAVRGMLAAEEATGVKDNLLCYWNVAESYYKERLIIVTSDDQARIAGFLADGLHRVGILHIECDSPVAELRGTMQHELVPLTCNS